jgi:hypothetical protein
MANLIFFPRDSFSEGFRSSGELLFSRRLSVPNLRSQEEKTRDPQVMLKRNRQTNPNIKAAIALPMSDSLDFPAGIRERERGVKTAQKSS